MDAHLLAPIPPNSAAIYQRIADFRAELARRSDIPADALRDMLTRLLTATELLLQSNDEMERTLRALEDSPLRRLTAA